MPNNKLGLPNSSEQKHDHITSYCQNIRIGISFPQYQSHILVSLQLKT